MILGKMLGGRNAPLEPPSTFMDQRIFADLDESAESDDPEEIEREAQRRLIAKMREQLRPAPDVLERKADDQASPSAGSERQVSTPDPKL